MIPFIFSNEIVFCFTLLTFLIVTLIGVVCFSMSISYKLKLAYILPEVFVSIISMVLFCYFADGIRIRYLGEDQSNFSGSLCFMSLWVVILIAIILLVLVTMWLIMVIKKRLSSLTAMSVKEALAALSSKLCFYDETGRILLLNEQIDSECNEIIGESLSDGKAFWSNMLESKVSNNVTITKSDGMIIVEHSDGRATCYKRIEHRFNGRIIYELSGTDISKELALKKEIEEKNGNLRKMNLRLRKYGETVTEVTKERETLAARVKVHSNLGSLILRTKKALSQENYDRDELIVAWNDIMSMIFASDDELDKFSEVDSTATSVGVRIYYKGKFPKKGTIVEKIFASAVFECVVNTARHTDGNELYVKMLESKNEYSITISNNGKQPTDEVKEGGGLSSLRRMSENVGGEMKIISIPKFTLLISIPKEENNER